MISDMSAEENKHVVADAARIVFNDKDLSQIETFFAPGFVDHTNAGDPPHGPQGQRAKVEAFIGAFPDLEINYTHQIAEDDLVAGRYVLTGTHLGDFAGIAATGNTISLIGHDLLRVAHGQMVEHWTVMDSAELMRQLGAD